MKYDLKHYAYIGDVVWELFVRKKAIQKTTRQDIMHKFSTKYVCASKQAEIIEKITENLEEDEKDIQKRGRNLKITINKKNNPAVHALATSFEVLIGYLYLNKKERLSEIFELVESLYEEIN